jgi:hypothetical protein
MHNEELRNLYASLYIIRMIKPRRMRWEGNVVRIRRIERALDGKARGKQTTRKAKT